MDKITRDDGRIDLLIEGVPEGWNEDEHAYALCDRNENGVRISLLKLADRSWSCDIEGAFGQRFKIQLEDVPVNGTDDWVGLRWVRHMADRCDMKQLLIVVNNKTIHQQHVGHQPGERPPSLV